MELEILNNSIEVDEIMGKWLKSVVMYTDGASRGNPGPASIGVLFVNAKGEEIATISEAIGDQTNNFAEYFAVIEGLKKAIKNKVTQIHLKSDSEFLIKQLKGEYKVKSETILPLYEEAKSLLKKFKEIKLEHVRREKNKEADRLANKALDSGKEPMEFKVATFGGGLEQASLDLDYTPPLEREKVDIKIIPMKEEYLNEYRSVLDQVAREEEHLCLISAPDPEKSRSFFKNVIAGNGVFLLAQSQGRIIGWLDIVRGEEPRFGHRGTLGMGILKEYRSKSVGKRLLETAIQEAEEKNFEQINLSVLAHNTIAIGLYRKLGFKIDGVRKNASNYKGKYSDFVLMTLEL